MKINFIIKSALLTVFLLTLNINKSLAVPLGNFEGLGHQNFQPSGASDNGALAIERVLSMVTGFLTILGGLWFLVQMLVAGLGWAGAGGDTKKVEEAKQKMTNGAIGLIIIVAAYSVVFIIGQVLGIDILNFASTINDFNN